MGIRFVRGQSPPFVIDRAPPAFIERVPGHRDLVADPEDPSRPLTFGTLDEAEAYICRYVDEDGLMAWSWLITGLSAGERRPA